MPKGIVKNTAAKRFARAWYDYKKFSALADALRDNPNGVAVVRTMLDESTAELDRLAAEANIDGA